MLAILGALKDEVKFILKEMDVTEEVHVRPAVIFKGEYLGKEVVVAHTGIGAEKMKRAADYCISQYRPSACINIGYCGALSPELSLGDVVIAGSVIHETEGKSFETCSDSPQLKELIKNATQGSDVKFLEGTILSVDKVVDTPHEKAYLGTKFMAIAVDMEATGLAESATAQGTPFAVIRAVMDPMDMALPKMNGIIDNDGSTNALNVVKNVVSHPQNIAKLPHLQYCAKKANESIERFVNELIKIY